MVKGLPHSPAAVTIRKASAQFIYMSEFCPTCKRKGTPLDAGAYRRNATEWVRFDNEEHRGYICSNCDWIFGAPVVTYKVAWNALRRARPAY